MKDKAEKGGATANPRDRATTGGTGEKDLKDKSTKVGKTADPTDQPPTGGTGDAAKAEQTAPNDETKTKQ